MSINDLPNTDIALYALGILGGYEKKILTEDITLKCQKFAPSRFSWVIHSKYPDMEIARKALFDCRGKGLVVGRHGKTKENQVAEGWLLTPKGIEYLDSRVEEIRIILKDDKYTKNRTVIDRQISQLEKMPAYKKYKKEQRIDNIKDYEFTDFLDASLDTPSSILLDRVNQYKALARTKKRENLLAFIIAAEKHFSNLF